MLYLAAAMSLTGRIRKNNEDNFCIDDFCLPEKHDNSELICRELKSNKPHLLGVFDGMGGYQDGEAASYIAAVTAQKHQHGSSVEYGFTQTLINFCMDANDLICEEANGSNMGTTCAVLALYDDHYTLCNIGDSPIFLVRDGVIRQLSIDHNQKASYERITGKPAPAGKKFKLTQCLGIPREDMLIEPYTEEGRLHVGDVLLLCSDGITDMLNSDQINETVAFCTSSDHIVTELTKQAMIAGGRDNITVICIQVLEGSDSSGYNFKSILNNLFRRAEKKKSR